MFLTIATFIGFTLQVPSQDDLFIPYFQERVKETIERAEDFSSIKEGMLDRFDVLVKEKCLEVTGSDKDIRPYFVALQGVIEHVLSEEFNKSISSLTGVIHTPMPPTPLCSIGACSKELVHQDIANDLLRLRTVKARTTILRDYLQKGGTLYAVYPKAGLFKRTEGQIAIYKQELEKHPKNLIDYPLECAEIQSDLVGAFYLFKSESGRQYLFAIKITQANDPKELAHFGLWFGELDAPCIQNRLKTIVKELQLPFYQ